MRRFILWTPLLTLVLAATLPALPATGADFKIGVVDLQRALNESSSGKKAKDQFKGEFEKMQNGLKAEKDALDRLKDDLDKKSAVLNDDQKKTKMEDFERRRRDLRRKLEDSDAELRKKDQGADREHPEGPRGRDPGDRRARRLHRHPGELEQLRALRLEVDRHHRLGDQGVRREALSMARSARWPCVTTSRTRRETTERPSTSRRSRVSCRSATRID